MAGAYMMRFMTAVDNRDISAVQQQLLAGYVKADSNYLGVFPLHLAIENGDVDMAAVLLTAGADVTLKANGKNKKDALGLATAMRDDPKCKFRQEAAVIVEIINDKEALKRRFDDVQITIAKKNAKDIQQMKTFCMVAAPCMAILALYFFYTGDKKA